MSIDSEDRFFYTRGVISDTSENLFEARLDELLAARNESMEASIAFDFLRRIVVRRVGQSCNTLDETTAREAGKWRIAAGLSIETAKLGREIEILEEELHATLPAIQTAYNSFETTFYGLVDDVVDTLPEDRVTDRTKPDMTLLLLLYIEPS